MLEHARGDLVRARGFRRIKFRKSVGNDGERHKGEGRGIKSAGQRVVKEESRAVSVSRTVGAALEGVI
jgi:hypothetical protein